MATSKIEWNNRITEACKNAGTYQTYFDDVIDTLAGILENRDRAQEQFEAMKCQPIVQHTNKGGNTNLVKNPALVIINECNAQALTFWKELGLTAKSFQAMQSNGFKKPEATLEEVLANIGA